MIQLPKKQNLPINLLAASFNNTSSTYKFYWFLSILQFAENGISDITKRKLFARMISNAWFTVNYFRVSFGKQDKLQSLIEVLKTKESLNIDDSRQKIFDRLVITRNENTIKHLMHFNKQVPHWFLSPWFPKMSKSEIYSLSQKFVNKCLYALYIDEIKINPEWENYLKENVKVLKEFCYWNLAMFLQIRNPNVPDIPSKLIKPAVRNSLIPQRKKFWDLVMKEVGSVNCIYSGKRLTIDNYAVEHFIPYSFVSHDLIWNLIPADKSFNSSKSDKLPTLDKYFNPFYKLQKSAIEIVKYCNPKNKYLEDYLTIFPDLDNSISKKNFRERIQPLISIASNNGFEFLK